MTDIPRSETSNILQAAAWMMGAVVAFSCMAVGGRSVSFELDTFEIMMFRSFVGLFVVVTTARLIGTWQEVKYDKLGTHALRNMFHFAGQNLWFYALTLIPLAQVVALEFTSPLWVLILSPLFLGERLTRLRVGAAMLGFIGVLLVARPSPDTVNVGMVSAALAAIGFAGTMILTKRLTRTQSLTCILFWMTAMQAVFGILCAGYDGDIAMPSAASVPWLILIGLAGLTAHFCLTKALTLAPATVVVPVDFLRLPVIAIIGMTVYAEPLDVFVILGAAIIFGANYANIWAETRKAMH
ncbi:MAG: DMT family transporter [Pseudomonadota bacterium]